MLEKKCDPSKRDFTFKIDIELTERVAAIYNLKCHIADILDLNDLELIDITEGCVIVTFLVPAHVADVIGQEFTPKQIEQFRDLKVIWLESGGNRLIDFVSDNRTSASQGIDHSEEVKQFVKKLWEIVNKPDYSKFIQWSEDGKSFVITKYSQFTKEVLPGYFKHSNFNSFVRQLNLYDFRKVPKPDQDSPTKSSFNDDDEKREFLHTNFCRDRPESLHLVQRRVPRKDVSQVVGGTQLSAVMSDIHLMKGRQEGIATVLETLKQDNEHLREEIRLLKEKSARQQKILNKIIHFLVHMIYKGKLPSRRPNPFGNRLMLMDSDEYPANKKIKLDDERVDEVPSISLDSPVKKTAALPQLPSPFLTPTTISSEYASDIAVPVSFPTIPSSSFSSLLSSPLPPLITSPLFPLSSSSPLSSPLPPLSISSSPPFSPSILALPSSSPTATTHSISPTTVATDSPSTSEAPVETSSSNVPTLPRLSVPDSLMMVPYSSISPTKQSETPGVSVELHSPIPRELNIPPALSSLVPEPNSEYQMSITGQLQYQQLVLDKLPEFLSSHLNLDPAVVSDFLASEVQLPEYDFNDTARLLESLKNPEWLGEAQIAVA